MDYKAGCFYVVKEGNQFVDTENDVDIGDIAIGYATVIHGVDKIDPDKKHDWAAKDGRWWFGLNVHNSDEMEESKRYTTSPYKINKSI